MNKNKALKQKKKWWKFCVAVLLFDFQINLLCFEQTSIPYMNKFKYKLYYI